MSGFVLHPEAYKDLDEIWEFLAEDSLDAADRIVEEISSLFSVYRGNVRPSSASRQS